MAGDPDILGDFIVPTLMIDMPPMDITGNFFTYTGFRNITMPMPGTQNFTVTKATMMEFPVLNGQSVAYAMLMSHFESVNPPHTHPRAAELPLVLEGVLSIGFVDTAGKLYTQDLAAGDMFVFPKGLVHYQSNLGQRLAVALSTFGSSAAGTVSVPVTVLSFKTDLPTMQKLKAALTPPPKK